MEFLMAIIGLVALALALFYFGPYLIELLVYMAEVMEEKAAEWRQIIDAIRGGSGSNGKSK